MTDVLKKLFRLPIDLLQKINNRFIRFLFVGCINTAVSYLLLVACLWVGMPQYVALLVSYVLGVLWNFKTTGYIVFENKNNRLIFKFFAVYVLMLFVNEGEMYLMHHSDLYQWVISLDSQYTGIVERFSLDAHKFAVAVTQPLVILPNAIITFLINKAFVFTDSKAKKQ